MEESGTARGRPSRTQRREGESWNKGREREEDSGDRDQADWACKSKGGWEVGKGGRQDLHGQDGALTLPTLHLMLPALAWPQPFHSRVQKGLEPLIALGKK